MANSIEQELKRMQTAFLKLKKTIPRAVGNEVRNRSLENFRLQAFNNEAWQERKSTETGKQRNLLVLSGRLRRSIRITRAEWNDVRVGTEVEYAKLHNEGGTTSPTITPKMRRYAWAQHYKQKDTKSGSFWKNLALSKKKKLTIRIPKRTYLGAEPELEKRIKQTLEAHFRQVFQDNVTVTIRLA